MINILSFIFIIPTSMLLVGLVWADSTLDSQEDKKLKRCLRVAFFLAFAFFVLLVSQFIDSCSLYSTSRYLNHPEEFKVDTIYKNSVFDHYEVSRIE